MLTYKYKFWKYFYIQNLNILIVLENQRQMSFPKLVAWIQEAMSEIEWLCDLLVRQMTEAQRLKQIQHNLPISYELHVHVI